MLIQYKIVVRRDGSFLECNRLCETPHFSLCEGSGGKAALTIKTVPAGSWDIPSFLTIPLHPNTTYAQVAEAILLAKKGDGIVDLSPLCKSAADLEKEAAIREAQEKAAEAAIKKAQEEAEEKKQAQAAERATAEAAKGVGSLRNRLAHAFKLGK